MKTIKKLSLVGFMFVLILSSCTIEKRAYMPGYHIDWNKSKQKPEKQELAKVENSNEVKLSSPEEVQQIENEIGVQDNHVAPTTSDFIGSESIENSTEKPTEKSVVTNNKIKFNASDATQAKVKKNVMTNKSHSIKKKSMKKNPPASGGKSQLVALLLCIFIGALGIHRFYLGYNTLGIIMLLTGGVCGILALVDLIRIITGDLKPKDDDYSEKL